MIAAVLPGKFELTQETGCNLRLGLAVRATDHNDNCISLSITTQHV